MIKTMSSLYVPNFDSLLSSMPTLQPTIHFPQVNPLVLGLNYLRGEKGNTEEQGQRGTVDRGTGGTRTRERGEQVEQEKKWNKGNRGTRGTGKTRVKGNRGNRVTKATGQQGEQRKKGNKGTRLKGE